MKIVGLALIVLGLAIAAAPVDAQGQTAYTLKGHADGADYYWTQGDDTAHNPTLAVTPGASITLTVSSTTGTHNIKVGDKAASDPFSEGDAAITYTFTAPASGDVTYICTIHGSAMSGKFSAGGSSTTTTPTSATEKKSPGVQVLGVTLALAGAALVVARRPQNK